MTQLLRDAKSIICWLDTYDIVDYNLIPDEQHGFIVDVSGDVDIFYNLKEISVQFGTVNGRFNCSGNRLTSLLGSPRHVGGLFNCSDNLLTNLEYCPIIVGDIFDCSHNFIKSLKYCPSTVNADFNCSFNKLTNLEFFPDNILSGFICHHNELNTLAYLPKSSQSIDFFGNQALGKYQFIKNFDAIKEKSLADSERLLLSVAVHESNIENKKIKI